MKKDDVSKTINGSDYWKYEEERSVRNYFKEIDKYPLLNEAQEKI